MLPQGIKTRTGLMIDTVARWTRRCIYSYTWRYLGYGLNSMMSLLNLNKKHEDKVITIHDYDQDLNITLNAGEHIGNRIYFNGYYEGREVRVLKKIIKQDDVIVDIGANIGAWTLLFGKMATKGKVYAIEPGRRFGNLIENIALNPFLFHVICYQLAIGNTKGQVIEDRTYGQQSNEGMTRFLPAGAADVLSGVEITTLDDWAANNKMNRMNWLKIDTEGMEYLVIQGAKKTLSSFRPNLMIEVNAANLNYYNSTVSGLYDLIYSHGYRYFYSAGRRGTLKKSSFTSFEHSEETRNIFCSVNPLS